MLQYKAGYKFVDGGVHAQVLDFPAAITCGGDLAEARQLLAVALIDVAETLLELGQPFPPPAPRRGGGPLRHARSASESEPPSGHRGAAASRPRAPAAAPTPGSSGCRHGADACGCTCALLSGESHAGWGRGRRLRHRTG